MEEADELTNMQFHHFDMDKRIPVDLDALDFQLLPELFAAGEAYLAELEEAKAVAKKAGSTEYEANAKKRLKGDKGLRGTDPW